jgi:hypothetical protein
MSQPRRELHCLDPDCDWVLIEPADELPPNDILLPMMDAAGGPDQLTTILLRQRRELIDMAIDHHLRQDHGARDPLAWAQEMLTHRRGPTDT